MQFGMTRSFDNLSLEIRAGRTTRNQALEIIKRNGAEHPNHGISKFCALTGLERPRFFQIVEAHRKHEIWHGQRAVWNFIMPDWDWT